MVYPQKGDNKKIARACFRNEPVSTKNAIEISGFLKGKKLKKAQAYLTQVIDMTLPVPYKRFSEGASHKPGTGMAKYPVNAAKAILGLLKSIESNMENQGLAVENARIKYMSANTGRRAYRGRRSRFRGQKRKSTNLSIVVESNE